MPAVLLDVNIHFLGGPHPHAPVSGIRTASGRHNLEEAELFRAGLALRLRLRLFLFALPAVRLLAYARGLERLGSLLLAAPACVADGRSSIARGAAGSHSGKEIR